MDGNRRFAKCRGLVVQKGHQEGFSKLENTLDWCLRLGVKVVTVYAFSTENFNRNPTEVQLLMDLAKEKFEEFATKRHYSEVIEKFGISVKVLGNVSLLPLDVQEAASRAVFMTQHNNGAILNVCFPYTSREEMALAVESLMDGVRTGQLVPSDISEDLINKSLYTGNMPPLDLMIRTSGEIRLSDFLLWQGSENCHIHYVDAFWPEFSFWDALPALHNYQSHYRPRHGKNVFGHNCEQSKRIDNYLQNLQESRLDSATAIARCL
ncbi:hypothetical protein HDU97_001526 [Phlyctochytrium planicorne]|nr:hypothetical protein HDU97_001526 [Phlyctochytrium planicorne]